MNNSEERFDNIEYESDWQSVADTQYAQPFSEIDEEELQSNIKENDKKKKEKSMKQLVVILQLVLCIIIFATFFILKETGSKLYETVANWYSENLNNSLIISSDFSHFDIDDLAHFFSTDDEA